MEEGTCGDQHTKEGKHIVVQVDMNKQWMFICHPILPVGRINGMV